VPAADDQELKLAKLWSRVDELEEEVYRQKERIRILEKGLTLGLVPEELRRPAAPAPKHEEPVTLKPVKVAPVVKAEPAKPAEDEMTKEDAAKFQTMLADAHDQYRGGFFGRAIVAYAAIAKRFGDKIKGGLPAYWTAKCWAGLREYNTARQDLIDFLKKYPTSPWAPLAKLELGRAEIQLDMRETALRTFRDVTQEYPMSEAAEMAAMELQNLKKNL